MVTQIILRHCHSQAPVTELFANILTQYFLYSEHIVLLTRISTFNLFYSAHDPTLCFPHYLDLPILKRTPPPVRALVLQLRPPAIGIVVSYRIRFSFFYFTFRFLTIALYI